MRWNRRKKSRGVVGRAFNFIWHGLCSVGRAIVAAGVGIKSFSLNVVKRINLAHWGKACVAGVLWVWRAIVRGCRATGQMVVNVINWLAISQRTGRALQVAKGLPRAFVNKAVLFNPPFYVVYTGLSLLVLLLVGSLVYWKYGANVSLIPHHLVAQKVDTSQQALVVQQQENIDKFQDIQQRLEARITATERQLKELEAKTVQVERQTAARVEKFEKNVDKRIHSVTKDLGKTDAKIAAVDKQVKTMTHKQGEFEKNVNKQVNAIVEDTDQKVASVDQKVEQVAGRVEHLENTDVVVNNHVEKEVAKQFAALREDAQERQKKLKHKKMLERFLDQLAESEDQ